MLATASCILWDGAGGGGCTLLDYISRRPPRPRAISYTYSVTSRRKDPVCSGQVSGPPHWNPHAAFGLWSTQEEVPMWRWEYRYARWSSVLAGVGTIPAPDCVSPES